MADCQAPRAPSPVNDTKVDPVDQFRTLCNAEEMEQAKALVQEHGAPALREAASSTLSYALAKDRMATAQWLVETFDLTADDIRDDDGYIFKLVSCTGSLAGVKWLHRTFALNAADARVCDHVMLRHACNRGDQAMVEWLVTTFEFTASDVRTAFVGAVNEGRKDVVAWLLDRFTLAEMQV